MNNRRVLITGLGVVSSIGIGKEKFWSGLLQGRSGVGPIRTFDASAYSCQVAGEITEFQPQDHMPASEVGKLSRASQFAVAAAKLAIEDANLDLSTREKCRIGTVIGTGLGGADVYENQMRRLIETGNPRRVHPWAVPLTMTNAAAAEIAILHGLKGPNMTLSTACSSGSHAIGYAFDLIQMGKADLVIAGGTEACIVPGVVAGFCSLRALSVRNCAPECASRPFDKARDGFVMGEGAAALVLETLESAQKRGSEVYAELLGYGSSCEAGHVVHPEKTGSEQARVMELALREARVAPEQVNYINTHGTSTVVNDLVETRAIKKLFGQHAYRLALHSTKSMIGHTIGAAGAIEGVVSALTVKTNIIHPTINYEEADPDCDLDYTPNEARERKVAIALSNSFGFGSNNCCLVMKAFG